MPTFTYGQRVIYHESSIRCVGVVVGYGESDSDAFCNEPTMLVKGNGSVKLVAESILSPYRHSRRTSTLPNPKRAKMVPLLFAEHRRLFYNGRAAEATGYRGSKEHCRTEACDASHSAFRRAYAQREDQ